MCCCNSFRCCCPWDWACLSLWHPPSTLQPGLNLHLSLQLAALSESCHLPPCSQPVCKLLCPFFTPVFTSLFTSCDPTPAWQPFSLSCFSLDTFQTVLCQGTVSTAVCFCQLTSSFHPCEAKTPENVLTVVTPSLLFFPLMFSCFSPSCIPFSISHSETQRVTSHTQSMGEDRDVPAAPGLWIRVWCFAAWSQAGNWTFPWLSFPLSSVLCISKISCTVQDNFLISWW